MSAFSGPEIPGSGLVFYYDMNNLQKSWKGSPTTNLVNPSWTSWTVDGSGQGNIGTRTISNTYECTIVDSSANTRQYIYIESGITASTTYTFSVQYKKISGAPTLRFQIQAYNGGTYLSTMSFATTLQLGISDIDDWQTASITLTTPASTNRILWFMQDGDDYTTYTHSFSLKNVQCEQQSFATPFVDGTRSNTQAIIDLTNNTTITAQSLTYNSDGSFSFDGSNNFAYINSTGFFSTGGNNFFADVGYAWTVSAWFKFPVTPSGTRTGNSSWVIFGQSGGIGGAETLTLFVSSATDTSLSPSVPYYCTVGIRGTKTVISPASVNTNTWNHAVVTWNGTSGRVYFNGADRGAANIGGAGIQAGYYASIGMTGNTGSVNAVQLYEGNITQVSIYNRALSQTEIAQNFQAVRGRFGI